MSSHSLSPNHKIDNSTVISLSSPPNKETNVLVVQYLDSLTDIQKQALLIAQNHLGTSFHIIRSNGFIIWKKKHGLM